MKKNPLTTIGVQIEDILQGLQIPIDRVRIANSDQQQLIKTGTDNIH